MTEKRFGRQEPTVGFTLPYIETKGNEAIEMYERTGRTALDWQRALIFDVMATDSEGLWTHSKFGYSVPRQNGKNEVIAIREIYGLLNGERIIHTAHRTSTSRTAWERLSALLEAMGIHEKSAEHPDGFRSGKSKGQEFIEMPENLGAGRIWFRTRTTTGGLGETFDLLVVDEAQEYQEDQDSALKYTIAASENPQTIMLGTPPTAYSSGTLFVKYREKVLRGEERYSGWAEWSVQNMTDVNDTAAWYETNPSLGYRLKERTIESEIGEDNIDFNIQRLGLWLRYNQKSEYTEAQWKASELPCLPSFKGAMMVGVKFSMDGNSCLSIALKTAEGGTFVESIGCRSEREGVGWIINFLMHADYAKVFVDGKSSVNILEDAMKHAKLKGFNAIKVAEFSEANATFEQAMHSKEVLHMEQPSLMRAVSNCEKRAIGTGGAFGYKSIKVGVDVGLLDSALMAFWAANKFDTTKKKRSQFGY